MTETFYVEPGSVGKRLYMIRLACGDGVRKAEPMGQFVKRVLRATGEDYDPATISMLERDKQGWRLKDMTAFAAVDPLNRGPAWLGFGEGGQQALAATVKPSKPTTPIEAKAATVERESRAEHEVKPARAPSRRMVLKKRRRDR